MSITINRFFRYYIFHTEGNELTVQQRCNLKIASIVLGILTAAIVHLICLAFYNRSVRLAQAYQMPAVSIAAKATFKQQAPDSIIVHPVVESPKPVAAPSVQPRKRSAGGEKLRRIFVTVLSDIKSKKNSMIRHAKEKRHDLIPGLFEKAKPYLIDPASNKKLIPAGGRSKVYFLPDLPLVLKPNTQNRYYKMKDARVLCEKNGYKHLVVPRAELDLTLLFESRLPIDHRGPKQQMGLYIENRDLFAEAVKEFTGFLCQSFLHDITGGNNDPYGTLAKTPHGRYDNISLYIQKGKGKIGLIDLEEFGIERHHALHKTHYLKQCTSAIHLFPAHLDEIIEAGKKFDPDIESYRSHLAQEAQEALTRFKLGYQDHAAFVKTNGITRNEPKKLVKVTKEKEEAILKSVREFLASDDNFEKDCLGANPNDTLDKFSTAFPKIFKYVFEFIMEQVSKRISGKISTDAQWLDARTVAFKTSNAEFKKLREKICSELTMLSVGDNDEGRFHKEEFADATTFQIFEDLVKTGVIQYYNPCFGYGVWATHCMFC